MPVPMESSSAPHPNSASTNSDSSLIVPDVPSFEPCDQDDRGNPNPRFPGRHPAPLPSVRSTLPPAPFAPQGFEEIVTIHTKTTIRRVQTTSIVPSPDSLAWATKPGPRQPSSHRQIAQIPTLNSDLDRSRFESLADPAPPVNHDRATPETPILPWKWQGLFQNLLVFSCGTALGTVLHTYGSNDAIPGQPDPPVSDAPPSLQVTQREARFAAQALQRLARITPNPAPRSTVAVPPLKPLAVPPVPTPDMAIVSASPAGGPLVGAVYPQMLAYPLTYAPAWNPDPASLSIQPWPLRSTHATANWAGSPWSPWSTVGIGSNPLNPLQSLQKPVTSTGLPLDSSEERELLGLLDQGDQSIALFRVNTRVEQVAVGEPISPGLLFQGIQDNRAIVMIGQETITIAVGQTF